MRTTVFGGLPMMLGSDERLSNVFVAAAVVAGAGTLLLQMIGGYGATSAVEYGNSSRFVFPVFAGIWFLHVTAYFAGRRVDVRSRLAIAYLVVQLALVVGLTLSSGRAIAVLLLYVIWGAQAVALRARQWPVIVVAGGTVALIAMSRSPTQPEEVITIVTMLTMIAMATYLVSYVRGVLVKREAKELLKEISSTHNELSGYASQVEEVALLNERQRMARELHDTLAQGLVGVTLQLEAADSQLEKGGARRAREIVGEAMSRARETLADARRAIHDLRENQETGGLEFVVRREATRFSTASGIPCDVDVDLDVEPNDDVLEAVKYVITEGLTNIAQHSRAKGSSVQVTSRDDMLQVVVSDDGVGFDSEAVLTNGHYGLIGLRERARQIDGTLDVESRFGLGVTLRLTRDGKTNGSGVCNLDE